MATSDTRTQLLERAFELVETRGYDGFSFADLAESVGIRKASIHHHFPTKADLGKELVERFRVECRARLEAIDRDLPPRNQLEAYATIFVETFDGGRMCLCGILAAGFVTLPEPVRIAVTEALGDQQAWLASVIRRGRKMGVFRGGMSDERRAHMLLGSLEGSLLLARLHGDRARFLAIVADLIAGALADGE